MSNIPSASFPHATPLVAEGAAAPAETAGGFSDLLDFINPLQHIPVVSTLYREATGDSISSAARIIGGGIFGGIPGLVASAANAVLDAATGQDAGEIMMSALKDISSPTTTLDAKALVNDGAPLVSDHGQALMDVATAMQDTPATPAPDPIQAAAAEALRVPGSLATYRTASLGLEDEGKREQLSGSLDEIALKM